MRRLKKATFCLQTVYYKCLCFAELLKVYTMANSLTNEKICSILKEFLKTGNAAAVTRNWISTFGSSTPSSQTVSVINLMLEVQFRTP